MEGNLYKTDKNGTKYYYSNICPACGGTGNLPQYHFNEGGRCFTCNGSGIRTTKWKVYTPEYQAKLDAKKLAKRKANASADNKSFLEKNNFNTDGYTFVALGSTYEIKDQLKEQGAKYNSVLGWHFNEEKENTLKVAVDSICDKDEAGVYSFKFDAANIVKDLTKDIVSKNSTSSFVGKVSDKLVINVTCKSCRVSKYSYHFETNYIYTFEDATGNSLVWKTTKDVNFEEGYKYTISCIIKAHTIYNNLKQTMIKNVKVL